MSVGHPSSTREQNTAAAARVPPLLGGKKEGRGFRPRLGLAQGSLLIPKTNPTGTEVPAEILSPYVGVTRQSQRVPVRRPRAYPHMRITDPW